MCFYTYGKEKTWESLSTDTIYDKHMAVNWRRVNTSILYTCTYYILQFLLLPVPRQSGGKYSYFFIFQKREGFPF